ncbi:MAG: gas vesicle protein GvpG [Actinomycetes bacterium]
MNLLTDVLLGPLTLPARGPIYVLNKIKEQAEQEFNDPTRIRKALINLQRRVDSGEMSLERYEALESILLQRLDGIEQRRTATQETTQAATVTHRQARRRRRRRS